MLAAAIARSWEAPAVVRSDGRTQCTARVHAGGFTPIDELFTVDDGRTVPVGALHVPARAGREVVHELG